MNLKEYLLETTINVCHLRPSLSCFQLRINRNQKLYFSVYLNEIKEHVKKNNLGIMGVRHNKLYMTFVKGKVD